jgi:hypothetical protein
VQHVASSATPSVIVRRHATFAGKPAIQQVVVQRKYATFAVKPAIQQIVAPSVRAKTVAAKGI